MPYADASSRYQDCQVCHLPAEDHLLSKDCGILAGPGHYDQYLTDGLCWGCQRHRERRAKLGAGGSHARAG